MCLTIASPSPVPPSSRERARVDPVEALGQARQVLARRCPRPGRRPRATTSAGRRAVADAAGHRHLAVRPAVFDRVVEQVLEDLRQFVAVALHLRQLRRQRPGDADAALGGAQFETARDLLDERRQRHPPVGARCSFSSMRDSDSRSSTSRVMRPACSRMMPRKRSRASASSRAGPSSVSINPTRRRQRRLQLVPGIGDEIGAHLLAALQAPSHRAGSGSRPRRRAPGRRSVHRRAGRRCARSTRSTGTEMTNSTLRDPSPASTASAAASSAGLRSAPAKSRGSAMDPMNSAAAALARTMRRWRSIRISGSGTADMTASAAASRASARPACSRQARSRRCIAGRIDRAAGLRRPSWSVVAAGSGPSAAATCRAATPAGGS